MPATENRILIKFRVARQRVGLHNLASIGEVLPYKIPNNLYSLWMSGWNVICNL